MLRSLRVAWVCAALLCATGLDADAFRQADPLADTIARAGRYIDSFILEASSIVAEEDYLQRASGVSSSISRRTKSDLAIVFAGDTGWIAFRDVIEVDGRALRDRDDRLARLFADPAADTYARAEQIVAEGARFNLNPSGTEIARTINVPITALRFLEPRHVPRSDFRLDWTTSEGRRLARLRFTERAEPRLIRSPDGAAASGAFLVDPDSGTVVQTDLAMQTGAVQVSLRTRYAPHPRFRSWLPVSMEETYTLVNPRTRTESRVDGRATYSNFRSFSVVVDEETSAKP